MSFSGTVQAQDQLTTTTGQQFQGTAEGFDGKQVQFKATLPYGDAILHYPINQIKQLELGLSLEEKQKVEARNEAFLEHLWKHRASFLSLPGTDSGQIGQSLIEAWLATKTPAKAQQALHLLTLLETTDWDKERLKQLPPLRLQALLHAGKIDDAITQANQWAQSAEVSETNRAGIAQAKFFQATSLVAQIAALEKAFPRWFEMKEKIQERSTLYHQALEHFLYPVVFTPWRRQDVSRGLWHAADLSLYHGKNKQASQWLDDLIENFPQSPYAMQAQALLKKQPHRKETSG